MTVQSVRVCVIGAGAAGLCAARHLAHRTDEAGEKRFVPTVYEQGEEVGGTWVYTPKTGDGVHSSMYKNLTTNLPKEVMAFQDFPFPDSPRSYLTHQEVRNYLRDYADRFNLGPFIEFNTEVKSVGRDPGSGETAWRVVTEKNGRLSAGVFDAVMVCSGHYADPVVPPLPDVDRFKGLQIHSHDYREPEVFDGQVVAVLGAASSGQDIALQITSKAKKVYLCHNKARNESELPDNMDQAAGVRSCLGPASLELMDGTVIRGVDAILYCTGYRYRYPFLEGNPIEVTDHVVKPLYKHFVSVNEPSLCFVGIPTQVCPFPMFNLQCLTFVKHLGGEIVLPDRESMMEEFEQSYREHLASDKPLRYFHKMGFSQWDYNRELSQLANEPDFAVPFKVEKLYEDVWALRKVHLMTYKEKCYQLRGDIYV